MFLTPADRVRDYEDRGWWSGESVDAVTRRAVASGRDGDALVDPFNRAKLDGHEPERLSWRQLDERIDRLAAALLDEGLEKDDVILAQLPNTVDAVLLFLACARLGAILSPVAMPYRRHELEFIAGQVKPRFFVTVESFAGFDHAALGRSLAEERGGLQVLTFGGGEGDLRAKAAAASPSRTRAHVDANPVAGGEVLTICWTSGTESRPKGVPRDHNHWILNAEVVADGTGAQEGDVLLNPFPLVNIGSIGGLVMPWLLLGTKLVLHHPFDLGVFLKQIEQERVSYTIAPPAVLTALLKQPQLLDSVDISSLHTVSSGSAPLSPWLIEGWAAKGIEITNVFGSNEGAGLFSSAASVPDYANRARYFPRFGAEGQTWEARSHEVSRSRLVDPETEEEIAEPGRPGELRLGGASIFSGYWNSPELTAAAFDEKGHYRTGDLFEIAGEDDRFYRFIGRSKEIIVRGGINISPAEIDDLLIGFPMAVEAATVGIPDDRLGERIAVAVVPADGARPTLEDVTAFLSERDVAIYKRPERLVTVDKLPRNPMNKVMRNELRAMVQERIED
ncbi:class I adenylate-forming enzyme family protein [Alteriqipengyuania lutimaris]|uniref:(2,3-dihydroxybenzoyl)adenylate synthase n=1 Tax=Alteriqipengyuania lutimaris TaxID=1538146 RepID=A0A395LRT3_9SPHN|nr:class I adenylate-forming enzyme family protein [Alteriqipengyuania lutimaris]MBB3033704.1 acyl-CoA synthetase (AMP-forming)/AMP-acid ligase II [Alteriqipengyuania lutimaris]RDS77310.1 (2,3-dihydroxybenzoyl)adenylate synthase [Alteriqipengyuania lutimaris]